MKTKEEIIKDRYPYFDTNRIPAKDIEIGSESVMELMQQFSDQNTKELVDLLRAVINEDDKFDSLSVGLIHDIKDLLSNYPQPNE